VTIHYEPAAPIRTPLSRVRIVEAALRYVDDHGLDALSMHKLGAALDVKGMSLYHHVANKNDLLDGVVEALWAEVEEAAPPREDWRQGLESFARAVRDMVRRHSNAASLVFSQRVIPQPALRVVRSHVAALTAAGFDEARSYDLMRTVTSYVFGSAFAEVTWDLGGSTGCAPEVSQLLRPGTPEELAAVAEVFCGQSDVDAQFELGLDLMLRGIEEPART
jgi:TetR/AcrR family tetracycline transcriptional repressor